MLPGWLEELDRRRVNSPREVAEELKGILPGLTDRRTFGLALGVYGSCLRALDKLRVASAFIEVGLGLVQQSWDVGSLLRRKSIVEAAKGDFEGAIRISDRGILAFVDATDVHSVGRLQCDQGMFHYHLARFYEAAQKLHSALALLDKSDTEHLFTCHHGLALIDVERGALDDCVRRLEQARSLSEGLGEIARARYLWSEGKMAVRLGRADLAERAYREVAPIFLAAGMKLDAVLATIEHSRACFSAGKREEGVQVAQSCHKYLLLFPEGETSRIIGEIWRQAEARGLKEEALIEAAEKLGRERPEGRPQKQPAARRENDQPPGTWNGPNSLTGT